jgi:hypothetical protein
MNNNWQRLKNNLKAILKTISALASVPTPALFKKFVKHSK